MTLYPVQVSSTVTWQLQDKELAEFLKYLIDAHSYYLDASYFVLLNKVGSLRYRYIPDDNIIIHYYYVADMNNLLHTCQKISDVNTKVEIIHFYKSKASSCTQYT